MFTICQSKGFQMKFANGWTVSVQFGPGNYATQKGQRISMNLYNNPPKATTWSADSAEIAAWDTKGNWFEFEHDTVEGYRSANEVAAFIAKVAAFPEG